MLSPAGAFAGGNPSIRVSWDIRCLIDVRSGLLRLRPEAHSGARVSVVARCRTGRLIGARRPGPGRLRNSDLPFSAAGITFDLCIKVRVSSDFASKEILMKVLSLHPRTILIMSLAAMLFPASALAQESDVAAMIASAVSAAPASVSDDARVIDWSMNELRAGSNGWTCLPDRADTEGQDPWCVNGPWLDFLHAYMNKTEPTYSSIGIAYMLQGDSPVSNSDPYAAAPTDESDWVTGLGAHLMMLVPDRSLLDGMTTDHRNGGPWVMWPGTPYAHLMIPIDSR